MRGALKIRISRVCVRIFARPTIAIAKIRDYSQSAFTIEECTLETPTTEVRQGFRNSLKTLCQ